MGVCTEDARINKQASLMYTIVTVILFLPYLVQFLSGGLGAGLFALIFLTDIAPMVATWIVYFKDPDSSVIKHIMGCGYGLFYAVVCFTSTQEIVFVYAIPMILVVTMFNDIKFSVIISFGVSIFAIIHSVRYAASFGWTDEAKNTMLVEIILILLITVFSSLCNRTIANQNDSKVKKMGEAREKTEGILDRVMAVSESMVEGVSRVSEQMTLLTASSEETLSNMQEVQFGATDSAESIQTQLYKTEEIQTQIDKVTEASKNISDNVVLTVDACHEGRDNIEKLMKQAGISEEAGVEVMKEVEALKGSTSQMESIVELIKSVASQTSLLALNASIEAARAGEAGRGFAVVATEISNLAGQTQNATGNISQLIEGISLTMTEVVNSISSLVESNKIQNESATITNGSFEKIVESIREIRTNSSELTGIVSKLASANAEIVESIQNISAITEEVSAHSTTTCEATEQNERIVGEVQEVIERLIESAEVLKSLEK